MNKKIIVSFILTLAFIVAFPCYAMASGDYTVKVKGTYHQAKAYTLLSEMEKQLECDLTWDSELEELAMERAAQASVTFTFCLPDGEMDDTNVIYGCTGAKDFIATYTVNGLKEEIESKGTNIGAAEFTSREGVSYWTVVFSKNHYGSDSPINDTLSNEVVSLTVNDNYYNWDSRLRNESDNLADEKKLLVGKTYYLKAYIDNDAADDKSNFASQYIKSSNKKVISVSSSGKITPKKPGIARITVAPSSNSNCTKQTYYCVVRPGKPTGVYSSVQSYSSIKIGWKKVSGTEGYRVYRSKSKNGTYTLVKTIKSPSITTFTDTGLKSKTKYYYLVNGYVTYDGNKYESKDSSTTYKTTSAKPVHRSTSYSNNSSYSYTVYITNTGACYHRGSCRWLYASKIPISRSNAIARGYRACKVCRP